MSLVLLHHPHLRPRIPLTGGVALGSDRRETPAARIFDTNLVS